MANIESTARRDSTARRRILGWGALAVGVVAIAGAWEGVTRAERDLERRTERRLEASGITGVRASFSGQDGTLRCDEPLSDPDRAEALTEDLWGVRVADVDRSCRARTGDQGNDTADTTPTTTEAAPATTEGTPAATEAPTTTEPAPASAEEPTTTLVTAGDVEATLEATLEDGRLVLTGTVADNAARSTLVDAAELVVEPANVDDQLAIAAADEVGLGSSDLAGLVDLVSVMPPNLVSGTVTLDGEGELSIVGVAVDAAAAEAVEEAVEAAGAEATLTERDEATASDAAQLTDELNEFVAANPILFEPGQATLTADADAVVEQVAAIANRFAGVSIEVIGHTDSDGDAGRNRELSRNRAETVRLALLERGVTAPLTSVGLGEAEPVLVNGTEDKAASRRVVFEITVA